MSVPPSPGSPVLTSVVVCTRNRGANAALTLRSILASTDPDLEVLLVDQSTTPDTRQAVERFRSDPRFRYLPSSQVGAGRARNQGLQAARGRYVLFTDDDCEVTRNWVEVMTQCFETNGRVAVVFSNVQPAAFDAQAGFIPTYVRDHDTLVTSIVQKCTARGIGAGMGLRREVALALGGFDARLGPGGEFPANEEGDLAVRALLKGWWIYETAKTHVVHDGFRTWQEGKALTRRNWVGIGAAYSKPIRCGHWQVGVIVAYEAFVVGLLQPASLVLRLRRPSGIRSFAFFWEGFLAGWRTPLDRDSVRYIDSDESELPPSS